MNKSRILTIALVICLVALAVISFLQFGGASGISYENADKYTAGETVVNAAVDTLDIDWTEGLVRVEYHAGPGIAVKETANRTLSENDKLRWWLDGTTLHVRYAKSGFRLSFNLNKNLTVSLPEGLVLKRAEVEATSADLDIGGLAADEILLGTTSGSIVAATDTKVLKAASTSGDMALRQDSDADTVKVGSTSGDIGCTLGSVKTFSAGSTSGALSLDALSVDRSAFSSTSGKISVRAGAFKEMKIGSTSGSVSAELPAVPGFTCSVGTVSGAFSSDIALTKSGNTYTAGDGSAKCSVGTTSGSITIGEYK